MGLSVRRVVGFGERGCGGKPLSLCCIIIHMATPNPSRLKVTIPKKELADFCRRYQVQKLALFGSVLGNNFRMDSDVDVLVSFQPNAHIGFITFSRMQRELSGLFQRPVDLVPMDGLKPVIRESVLADIEEVYAA
jgi:predicted nucleotidyltransferase